MSSSRTSHRTWRTKRTQILEESDICWLCGHDGSDSVDHIVAVKNGGTDELENLAPAHLKACPTCGIKCNLVKGSKVNHKNHATIENTTSKKWY